jgi:protein-S-isoprenylcysteine O-methyltransferase Ste14
MTTIQFAIIGLISLLFLLALRDALHRGAAYGIYRFFAWECILLLIVIRAPAWFDEPFFLHQIVSWLLLFLSIVLAVMGFRLLLKLGKPEGGFENTTRLVQSGIFAWIRHPLYASLLCLSWGVFFKLPDILGFTISLVASVFLYATAREEEKENLARFGEAYQGYMRGTKMFVPRIF